MVRLWLNMLGVTEGGEALLNMLGVTAVAYKTNSVTVLLLSLVFHVYDFMMLVVV